MHRLVSSLRRFPLRMLLEASFAAYLIFLGFEGIASISREPVETAADSPNRLALYGTDRQEPQRIPVAVPLDLRELRQTYEILGIICRDETDRSVFVRDLTTRDERIYRVGDTLNGTTVAEIHPTYVVLTAGGSRTILSLFTREPEPPEEEQI